MRRLMAALLAIALIAMAGCATVRTPFGFIEGKSDTCVRIETKGGAMVKVEIVPIALQEEGREP